MPRGVYPRKKHAAKKAVKTAKSAIVGEVIQPPVILTVELAMDLRGAVHSSAIVRAIERLYVNGIFAGQVTLHDVTATLKVSELGLVNVDYSDL